MAFDSAGLTCILEILSMYSDRRTERSSSGFRRRLHKSRVVANAADSDYYPWDYRRQNISIGVLVHRRGRHIQPALGPEKAFGQALREIRKSRNLSQEQLALESEFDRTYVSLVERGIQSPTVRTIVKLAATLRVRPSVIIRRMERILDLDVDGEVDAPMDDGTGRSSARK